VDEPRSSIFWPEGNGSLTPICTRLVAGTRREEYSAAVNDESGQADIAKVRIGLAIVTVVVIIAVVLVFAIDSAAGKAIMFAVAVTAVVRAYMLTRSLRRDQRRVD
jgi:hypothetical protein